MVPLTLGTNDLIRAVSDGEADIMPDHFIMTHSRYQVRTISKSN